MKMYSKDGIEMMHMKSLIREGDNLVVNSKVMKSMSMIVCLKPEDLWEARHIMSWPVIWYLPIMFIKGIWRTWRKGKN